MAYVSVAEWRPEQVTEWLKGLDNSVLPYLHWFSNNEVNGQQLLNLSPDELTHLGVSKLGHQELILEAVQHLRNFHYELDRENLQLLALRLSCAANSLHNEIRDQAESSSVHTQMMADVANVVNAVKPLVSWLDKSPFAGQSDYAEYKSQLLRLSLEMATCAQRDRFAERPVAQIRVCTSKLAKLADFMIQDITDPMLLQPATLDLATIKKKVGEDLGFFLVPSFHGIHQIGDMKLSSPAHQSGKIQQGDEIVQVNYQTVVGWSRKKVLALFDESPNDLLLTLKRRPRHVKIYGQIYMKPYRLPSRKRVLPYSRWNDNLPSPRPELLTIPHFDLPRTVEVPEKSNTEFLNNSLLEPSVTYSSSDEEFGQPSDSQSPTSMRIYLPKPRAPIQRRFTLSGPPRPSAQSEQFWRELQLERSWRSNQNNSQMNNSDSQNIEKTDGNVDEIFQLRDKSASFGNSIATGPTRPATCMPFTKDKMESVKFNLPKDSVKSDVGGEDKFISEEKDSVTKDSSSARSFPDKNISVEKVVSYRAKTMVMDDGSINSSSNMKLSITELNKLKREAFFNNMDCTNLKSSDSSSQASSEKIKENVKAFISEVKSECQEIEAKTPGKVMQLIGNFEKKELDQKVINKKKLDFKESDQCSMPRRTREKGRLDKSSSTPAYDLNDSYQTEINFFGLGKNTRTNESVISKNLSDDEVLESKKWMLESKVRSESLSNENEKENHGQMVNTINDHLLPDGDFYGKTSPKNYSDDGLCYKITEKETVVGKYSRYEDDSTYDYKARKKTGEILDTVNLALVEINEREDHLEMHEKQKDVLNSKNDFFKDVPPAPREIKIDQFNDRKSSNGGKKPIPAQRKIRASPDKTENVKNDSPGPLPPKPRSRPLPPSPDQQYVVKPPLRNRSPPEPPPRPESTFLRTSPAKKCDLRLTNDTINASEVMKKNIVPIINATGVPSSPVNLSPPLNYDGSTNVYDARHIPVPIPTIPERESTRSTSSPLLRRATPVLNVSSEKSKPSGGGTLESLKAILTLGRKPMSSPRSVRKKNELLAKKRNVSVKEISTFENAGYLCHRNRKGSATGSWTKSYFVLQGANFYGFKSKESLKADLFIHLPGFTCTIAGEVKSKSFPFKIYHTGKVFYFAADNEEDQQQWLDCVSMATMGQDDRPVPETVTFSETDTEPEPDTCFPTSPKMKKFLGTSPVPKPARSHQNLASDSKKSYDIQKKFGSLKKFSSQKHSTPNSSSSVGESSGIQTSEVASLDRKYLRFLGQKNAPIPVPTSQFRSYRRMQPPLTSPPNTQGKPTLKLENVDGSGRNIMAHPNVHDPPRLTRRTLHSSNPSLVHPDMADYRITQERLAEFRRIRNQERPTDLSGLMTLEQFMLSRQEEERLMRSNRNRPPEQRAFIPPQQCLNRPGDERVMCNRCSRSNRTRVYPSCTNVTENNLCSLHHEEGTHVNSQVFERPITNDKPQVVPRTIASGSKQNSFKLKNAAQYQPPPIPHSPSANQSEEPMFMAFEMALDQNTAKKKSIPKYSAGSDCSMMADCSHLSKDPTPDYPGIEYPPTFEPETYTLQYMLKNRRKRDANKTNK